MAANRSVAATRKGLSASTSPGQDGAWETDQPTFISDTGFVAEPEVSYVGANESITIAGGRTEKVISADTGKAEPGLEPLGGNGVAIVPSPAASEPVPDADGFGAALMTDAARADSRSDSLTLAPAPLAADPTHSIGEDNLEELLDHLNRDGEQWPPGSELRVGFPQSLDQIPDYFRDMDNLANNWSAMLAGLSFFTPDQQELAMQALEMWADIANVTFTPVGPDEDADIYFYALSYGANVGGYSSGVDAAHGSRIVLANWVMADLTPGAFGFHALVHEAGHSLGLDHPGEYDVGNAEEDPQGYQPASEYIEDTLMYSIMSYNSAILTGFDPGPPDDRVVMTPRTHDIYVMHQLYGPNWNARAGDSTYGYNATGVGELYDFTNYEGMGEHRLAQLTIWDGGGEDTLDLSGDPSGVTLDLRPGAFSSTHGMTYNISLAYVPEDAPDEFAGYIENARGGAGSDSITGNDRDNILRGEAGYDVLTGLGGDDELLGGQGNDTLNGGLGVDWFDGGSGNDTVDYTYSSGHWTIELADDIDDPADFGTWGSATTGGDVETIINVENARMGSGNDHVTGSSLANDLYGGDGNDTLVGLAGNDRLEGGEGSDDLDGGEGADLIFGEAGHDEIVGGAGADDLYGGIGNDTIYGNAGNDAIYGQDGQDIIFAGDDDDVVSGGDGDDTISGGFGLDDLDGGAGNDTVDFTYSNGNWVISLTFETASAGGDVESVRNFEGARMGGGNDVVRGTTGANNIYGGAGHDELAGLAGIDWLDGEGGDDLLNGGAGDDVLIGGSGYDIASYRDETAGVRVDLGIVGYQDTVGSGDDLLQSIEGLIGSVHDDWLIGNAGANQLSGHLGNDQMFGGDGADLLDGGNGNDNLFGGNGNDILAGGDGTDWASYLFQSASVSVNLNNQNSQNTLGAGWDTLTSIENLVGTAFNDLLIGNSGGNRLEGQGGNDVLSGADGGDVLFGGAGNDSLNGGLGNDSLQGGSGTDWALYNTGVTGGVTIDLLVATQNTGGAGIDTLEYIENVMGSLYGDSLTGNNAANELRGEAGNDWIWGNGGNDTVNGGSGDDAIAGGTGADVMIGGSGNDHIWGGSSGDTLVFAAHWGDDWIWDFDPASDTIDLSGVNGLDGLLQVDIEDTDDGALVSYGTDSILLIGVAANMVQDDNFIF
jgi:Ca2+-binding RTX toxin-like protein